MELEYTNHMDKLYIQMPFKKIYIKKLILFFPSLHFLFCKLIYKYYIYLNYPIYIYPINICAFHMTMFFFYNFKSLLIL